MASITQSVRIIMLAALTSTVQAGGAIQGELVKRLPLDGKADNTSSLVSPTSSSLYLYVASEMITAPNGYLLSLPSVSRRGERVVAQDQKKITVTRKIYQPAKSPCSIVIQYPQISGLGSRQQQELINRLLREAFNVEGKDKARCDKGGMRTAEYRIAYQSDSIISIVADHYVNESPDSRGGMYRDGINIDVKRAKRLTIDDMLEGYETYADSVIRRSLDAQYGVEADGYETIDDISGCYITEQGLVIFLDGIVSRITAEVLLEWREIQRFIRPGAGLESFVR